jgi:hypothetical protein
VLEEAVAVFWRGGCSVLAAAVVVCWRRIFTVGGAAQEASSDHYQNWKAVK